MDMLADGCERKHMHTNLAGDGCASCSGSKTVAAVLFSKIVSPALCLWKPPFTDYLSTLLYASAPFPFQVSFYILKTKVSFCFSPHTFLFAIKPARKNRFFFISGTAQIVLHIKWFSLMQIQ